MSLQLSTSLPTYGPYSTYLRTPISIFEKQFSKSFNFFQFFFTSRSLVLLLLSLRYGIRTSPAQFFFYFFSLITGAATLRSIIFRKMESDSNDNYEPIDDNETYYADYIELDTVHCNC